MVEDDRAVAEGSASWGLEGRMGLHLRGRGLQLSPYEESGDSSNVSRGRCVLARPENESAGHQRMQTKNLPESQNHGDWRESKSQSPFFRSLLGKHYPRTVRCLEPSCRAPADSRLSLIHISEPT